MKKWQKYWLIFLIVYSSLHLIRDVLQDLGIKTLISTILVKNATNPVASSILWNTLNTYLIAIIEIVLAVFCLKKNKFAIYGQLTIIIALITLVAWSIYWFFL